MKNSIVLLVFILSVHLSFANKYESAMGSAIEKLYAANDQETYVTAATTFERIGDAEKDQWLPYYYAGLGYIWSSHTINDGNKIDEYLDQAQSLVDKAEKLSPNNDEIVTLQGYIYMMKVVVDPPTRGPEYSGLAMQEFGRAVGMNADNPRALLLLGRMKMGTDQFFGNDLSESCGMISKASQMFDDQKTKSKLDPVWGKEMAEMFVNECKSN